MTQPVYVNGLRIGGTPNNNKSGDKLQELRELLYDQEPAIDDKVLDYLEIFKCEWNIQIPKTLETFISWNEIDIIICEIFPTNNHLIVPGQVRFGNLQKWAPVVNTGNLPTQHMIRIMDENQGCCFWYAGWNDGDEDCRIYVSTDEQPEEQVDLDCHYDSELQLTANSLGDFFIDYAQEGMELIPRSNF